MSKLILSEVSLGDESGVHRSTSLVGIALLSSCILILVYISYIRFLSPLAGIPGPFLASISRLWLAYHSRKGDMHRVMQRLHKRHGPIVRTAPNEVSISDHVAIKEIYGPGSKFEKSSWYSVWQGTQPVDLFAERNIDAHAALRRVISRMYAMSSMTALEGWVDNAISVFFQRMRDQNGKSVDLGKWLQLLAFDVIGEVSFSKRFGYLEAGDDDGTLGRIERALQSLAWVGQVPWLFWLDHYLAPFIGHHLDLVLRHGTIRSYAAREVENRKGRPSEHADILGQLFTAQKEKPDQLSENAVISIATANVFAGSDTTAITLRAIIYNLLKNPECCDKLLSEIKERKDEGSLTFPVKFAQAASMPYLQACISESLRLHPAVGMALPRVVPKAGLKVGDRCIPPGIIVGSNAWVAHQDPSIWGDHVAEFRPERWLKGNKGEMERYSLAFGGGARSCIGKSTIARSIHEVHVTDIPFADISLMEMSKLIPELFNEFQLVLTNPTEPLVEECRWFVKQEGLFVNLHPRKSPL